MTPTSFPQVPLTRVSSGTLHGVDAVAVEIEVNSSRGDPKFVTADPPGLSMSDN